MGNWRRYQSDYFQQERHWRPSGSKYKRTPSVSQPTVPSWEKRFCTSVCKIPWRKICESKRYEPCYKNVVEWNDSAGQEAFQYAKARFWAKINGLQCHFPLPDPDLYIDMIDWSLPIDPSLLSALDGERTVSEHGEDDGKLQIQECALWNQPIIPTGWGDIDDNPVMTPSNAVGPRCENYNHNLWGHVGEENKVV